MRRVHGEVAVRFDKHAVAEGCCLMTQKWRKGSEGIILRLSCPSFPQVFATILGVLRAVGSILAFGMSTSLFVSDIRLRHRGRATVLRNEDTALSYVLLEVQEPLKLIRNFILEAFQLLTPQDYPSFL